MRVFTWSFNGPQLGEQTGLYNIVNLAGIRLSLPASNFTKAGVKTALWDLRAQLSGELLAKQLGETRAQEESGFVVGLYANPADLLRTIARYLPEGYRRVKIKSNPGGMSTWCAPSETNSAIFRSTWMQTEHTVSTMPVYSTRSTIFN